MLLLCCFGISSTQRQHFDVSLYAFGSSSRLSWMQYVACTAYCAPYSCILVIGSIETAVVRCRGFGDGLLMAPQRILRITGRYFNTHLYFPQKHNLAIGFREKQLRRPRMSQLLFPGSHEDFASQFVGPREPQTTPHVCMAFLKDIMASLAIS